MFKKKKKIVHHLAVSSNWKGDQGELESIVNISHLRSMTVFGKWRPFFRLHKMRLLRVLDLEDTSGLVDHHLKHIGKLLHLRYLSLRGCGDMYHLPDSLGNLRQLETLDVKGTRIIKLPKTINKLTKLQHVLAGHVGPDDDGICASISEGLPKLMRNKLGLLTVFSAGFCAACFAPHLVDLIMDTDGDHVNRRDVCTMCCCAMLPALVKGQNAGGVALPRGINKLKALHTLGTVNVSGQRKTALQDIKGFTRLRKLGVAGINRRNGQELCSAIANLRRLESLSVYSGGKQGLVGCLDGMSSPPEKLQSLKLYGTLGGCLPEWIQGLKNLVKLKLRSSQLREYTAMEVLGSLPNLVILILLEKSFEGEYWSLSFQTGSFPSLLVLQLQSLVGKVEFEQGATPKLELLRLSGSSRGDYRFCGLYSLPSLREVVLSNPGHCSEHMTEDMRRQLDENPNRPVLRMGN
jgi:Leucine-rich repeat (LRR) protein